MPLIPLDQITRNPKQPRETFPKEHIEQLAASIKARGLIQAITLRRIEPDRYMIVAGECRFRAHELLGAETIRAEIVDIDEDEMQLRAIVENLQRHEMNPIEEANAFRTLLNQGYDAHRIAKELGLKSTALVTQRTQLLELTPEIQKLVASGQLPSTMAWGVSLVSPRRQAELLKAIAQGKLRTSEQVKAAGIALRDAEMQMDAFDNLPKASSEDLKAISRLERKIALAADMLREGFKDGECVAAQRVAPDRLVTMADQLVLVRKHVLQMEHDLRRVATTTDLLRGINENSSNQATVGVADRHRRPKRQDARPRAKGRREPLPRDEVSRTADRSRVSKA